MLRFLFFCFLTASAAANESVWNAKSEAGKVEEGAECRITVSDQAGGQLIPFRIIVKGSDGKFADGSGRNVYKDGRFFADGETLVKVPAGKTEFHISRGPEYVPLDFSFEIPEGHRVEIKAELFRWISLEERGWYGGDNHVHAKHDEHTPIKTDLSYAVLQARANGLSFITEAGSNVSYDQLEALNRPDFAVRHCGEIRPGPYVGHLNPAGLFEPFEESFYENLIKRPLPAQAIFAEVHKRGGAVIHTHALMPRHQLHWMGAAEAWSDAISGQTAHLLDVDANHTELLWFAMLNAGARIGVSGHTDAALGRDNTPTPGDNRVYCRADRHDYAAFVDAMRRGRTMATNGGPLFAFLSIGEAGPGDTMKVPGYPAKVRLEVESLAKVQSAGIYLNGERKIAWDVREQLGSLKFEGTLEIPADRDCWVNARVQDVNGKWCLTSPVFFEGRKKAAKDPAAAILFEISNATRFADLSRNFFAHVIATVRAPEKIKEVELLRDGEVWKSYESKAGNQLPSDGKIPVTGMWDNYSDGHIWHPAPETPQHFQGDAQVLETGWYSVRVRTNKRTLRSDAVRFEKENPLSHSLSAAKLLAHETELNLWGYGADVEHATIRPPLVKGSWWYPKDIFWRTSGRFGERDFRLGWPTEQPVERFRASSN